MKVHKYIILIFNIIRCLPHLILFYIHKNRNTIKEDLKAWNEFRSINIKSEALTLIYLLSFYKEFRNLYYLRIGYWGYLFNIFCPRLSSLYIHCKNIGGGTVIQHGFSTIINAQSIGRICWINQQVTIGYTLKGCPVIGNNVLISCGAKVLGNITIGDNVKIGANAVVVKNVPANCTVIGNPAFIVRRDGEKVNEKL